ncbi:MAG: hypothetical protein IH934_06515 [Nanoarchaeota archaeon]|nr:hypothetical protein [Nanoarchaeota archaeon]
MGLNKLVKKLFPGRDLKSSIQEQIDLNEIIEKIEKYLGKPLKFSLREFKQLQLLRKDVLKLEEIMGHPSEDSVVFKEHYKKHAQALEKYSERIERRLDVWIKRLEQLITAEELNLTAADRQYLESWKNNINICRYTLVRILSRGGQLHKLINKKKPNWKKVEAKITEALGDNMHPGIRTLVVLFEQLEQTEENFKKAAFQKKAREEYQRRLEQLRAWHFPVQIELQLADFLVKHWNGTTKLANAADEYAGELYQFGLPAIKNIINERMWPMVVEGCVKMAKVTRSDAGDLFQNGFPAVKNLINEETWQDFVDMVEAAFWYANFMFKEGFPAVEDLIREKPWIWPGIVEIVKATKQDANQMLKYGLPAVKEIINEKPWTWPGMIEMAKAARRPSSLFSDGLPAVEDMINKTTWPVMIDMVKADEEDTTLMFQSSLPAVKDLIMEKPWILPGLVEIVKMTKEVDMPPWYKGSLFKDGFPAVKAIVNEKPWTWPGMVEMAKAAGRSTENLYRYGLPIIKNIIKDKETWQIIVEGFIDMTKAAGASADELFRYGLPAVKNITTETYWPRVVEGFVKMTKTPTWNRTYLFRYGLPAVKNIIDERTWPMIVEDIVEITKAVNVTTIFGFYFSFRAVKYIVKSEEDWQIIVKFLNSIKSSRQKLELFTHIGDMPPSVLRAFSDFILIVMDKQPSHMVNILKHIRILSSFKSSVSAEILQFAKIVRTFRLNPREYPSERIKKDIHNTYIFLAQQTMKKNIEKNLSGLDRDIEKLSNSNAEIRRATMDKISKIITPLIVEYLEHVSTSKFEQTWHEFTGIGINKDVEEKHFEDLVFALQIAMENNRPEAKLFLEQISLGNFYPEKDIKDCYPYDQKESLAFIAKMESKGVDMRPWLYGFERTLNVQSRAEAEHVAHLIKQRTEEALQLYKELGIQTTKEDILEAFKKIKDNPNQAVVQDIKLHLHTIKSLEGGIRTIGAVTKAKVYIELNPLKVLQMGEKVSGSCLSLGGGNARETITNAIDVNKRVVWAEHDGRILGRVLLAMNDNGEILRYLTYYAFTGIDLENTFNAFVQKLAKSCHTKISNRGNISLILASHWYPGSSPE